MTTPKRPGVPAELLHRAAARHDLGRKNLTGEWAALSRNHPDYGMTVAEHEQMKWARANGLTAEQSIEAVWARIAELAHGE